jgi:hypothetical protein
MILRALNGVNAHGIKRATHTQHVCNPKDTLN